MTESNAIADLIVDGLEPQIEVIATEYRMPGHVPSHEVSTNPHVYRRDGEGKIA